jgi:hypothetical protein
MSRQAVSAVIVQNSARLSISWLPHKFRSLKTPGPLFLMTFPFLTVHQFFAIFTCTVYILLSSSACCLASCHCHHSPPTPPCTKDSPSRYFKTGNGEKLGLVWRNRKKISQIINVYFHLPFFFLFIL